MSTPWFFLSYSSADDEEKNCVAEFYRDLVKEVRRKGALKKLPDKDVGFLDGADIELGDEWDPAIAEALQTSRTLVCLYSPNYFESGYCLKELSIFRSRLAGYKNDAEPGRRPRRILPVLWEKPDTLPATLPGGVSGIQNKHKALGDEYAREGLLFLKKTKREGEYNAFLDLFAGKLVYEAKAGVLPPLINLPSIEEPVNAPALSPDSDARATDESREVRPDFAAIAEHLTPYDDVTELSASPSTPRSLLASESRPPDFWWLRRRRQIISAALGGVVLTILIALGVVVWRWKLGGDDNANDNANANLVTNTNTNTNTASHADPTIPPDGWSDTFSGQSSDGGDWLLKRFWDLPERWAPKWERGNQNGLLEVQGTEPGGVTYVAADFVSVFRIKFEEGTKIGWMFRAQGQRQTGYSGYCFLLQRTERSLLLTTYWGQPQSPPVPAPVPAEIPFQYDKAVDFIEVQAKAKGNEIYVVFSLRGSSQAPTVDLTACLPYTVRSRREHPTEGHIVFFAGDNETKFGIVTIQMNLLTPELEGLVECNRPSTPITIE